MKALITGGSGFLGRKIVAELLDLGAQVRCFLRPSSSEAPILALQGGERVEIVRGNLSRRDDCLSALADCDVVIHAAAELVGATPALFLTNVTATRTFASVAVEVGVHRFVLVSSLGVYDAKRVPEGGILDEQCPIDAKPYLRDPYSYSKVVQEEVCWGLRSSERLPLVVVRPGVIYGPGKDCFSARVGLRLGGLVLVMGGRQLMPYTHVVNCASGVVRAGLAQDVEGDAFNLIDDGLITGAELLKRRRVAIGPIRSLTVPYRAISALSGACEWYNRFSRGQLPAVLTRYKSASMWRSIGYSNDHAKTRLGWEQRVKFDDGLQETFDWMRNHRAVEAGA